MEIAAYFEDVEGGISDTESIRTLATESSPTASGRPSRSLRRQTSAPLDASPMGRMFSPPPPSSRAVSAKDISPTDRRKKKKKKERPILINPFDTDVNPFAVGDEKVVHAALRRSDEAEAISARLKEESKDDGFRDGKFTFGLWKKRIETEKRDPNDQVQTPGVETLIEENAPLAVESSTTNVDAAPQTSQSSSAPPPTLKRSASAPLDSMRRTLDGVSQLSDDASRPGLPKSKSLNANNTRGSSSEFPLLDVGRSSRAAAAGSDDPLDRRRDEDDEELEIGEHYMLGHKIGDGSFAQVFRAVDEATGRIFAVKQMSVDDSESNELNAKTIQKEIDLLKLLRHPNLVRYLGTRREGSQLLVFLEYCDGGSIAQMLAQFGRFSEQLIVRYARQMTEALCFLHERGIVHRDVKGANVLVSGERNVGRAKLADFGCSKRAPQDGDDLNADASLLRMRGTVLWMAPEAARQDTNVTYSSDVWSLGMTVVEMATGSPPWRDAGRLEEIAALIMIATATEPPEIPNEIKSSEGRSFVASCVKIEPEKRLSAEQLLHHPFLTASEPS